MLADFTDRGSEFTSAACLAVCDRLGGGVPSAPGSCLDNAVAESFFAALKARSSTASTTAPPPGHEPRSSAAVGERVADHRPVPWDRRW